MQTLESNIQSTHDLDDLKEYQRRLDVVKGELQAIQVNLQTIEYNKSKEGGRRNITRKYPRNLVIHK